MGVKAKETIRRGASSFRSLLLMLALLIGFQYGYAYLVEKVSGDSRSLLTGVAMFISLAITFFVIRKVVPWYEVELADKNLIIKKAIFATARPIAAVPLKQITDIRTVDEAEDFSGRKLNFTIFGIKDKKKYIISWKQEKRDVKVILQLGDVFVEKLKKEMIRVRKK
ncbi:hypothetical protein J0B03_07060 [Alkalibacter rhizosphaerae]|uniref:PH domain-containing protein n=1 Tax=Alkalibacter rhizosphaerae TaxID=2815577 RepID=A0A974XFD4_9FIRM|nr:hypothetical protein [Alkalibacter rhizosphaerae]QSX07595.1 hypothetical protein J0B03_07060 [Alkalibacter rhizosphaerae]